MQSLRPYILGPVPKVIRGFCCIYRKSSKKLNCKIYRFFNFFLAQSITYFFLKCGSMGFLLILIFHFKFSKFVIFNNPIIFKEKYLIWDFLKRCIHMKREQKMTFRSKLVIKSSFWITHEAPGGLPSLSISRTLSDQR